MEIAQLFKEYGPAVVFAVFSWFLIRQQVAQNERLANLLNNHLAHLLERQEKLNQVLDMMLADLREHWRQAADWHKRGD